MEIIANCKQPNDNKKMFKELDEGDIFVRAYDFKTPLMKISRCYNEKDTECNTLFLDSGEFDFTYSTDEVRVIQNAKFTYDYICESEEEEKNDC